MRVIALADAASIHLVTSTVIYILVLRINYLFDFAEAASIYYSHISRYCCFIHYVSLRQRRTNARHEIALFADDFSIISIRAAISYCY